MQSLKFPLVVFTQKHSSFAAEPIYSCDIVLRSFTPKHASVAVEPMQRLTSPLIIVSFTHKHHAVSSCSCDVPPAVTAHVFPPNSKGLSGHMLAPPAPPGIKVDENVLL